MRSLGNWLPLLLLTLLSGCSGLAVRPITPHEVAEKGLLVGALVGGAGLRPGYRLVINRQPYRVAYHGGGFALALPPGDYELEALTRSGGATHGTPKGRSASASGTYPISRRFHIEAGRITTLGGIYLLANRLLGESDAPDDYRVVQVDNAAFMRRYLARYQGAAYQALADKRLHPGGTELLDGSKLDALRQLIALSLVRPADGRPDPAQADRRLFVHSLLGVAGWVTTDGRGLPRSYTPLPLDTQERVLSCEVRPNRYACLVSTAWSDDEFQRRILLYRDGREQRPQLPPGANPLSFHLFGDAGIAAGDVDYRFYVRTGPSQPWQQHRQPGVQGDLGETHYRYLDTEDGFFTYYDGNRPLMTFTDAASGATRTLPLPEGFDGGSQLVATGDGLLNSQPPGNDHRP